MTSRATKRQIARALVMAWVDTNEKDRAPNDNTMFFYPHHLDGLFDLANWDLDQRVEVRIRLVDLPNWDDGAMGPDEFDKEKQ